MVFLPSGEGLQAAGVGEGGSVVADLGQDPGAGQIPQAGEAGDDLGVRVLFKMGDRRLSQLICGGTGGLELARQRGQLDAHGVFDHGRLVQVGVGEHRAQSLDVAVEVAAPAGFDQQSAQPRGSQLGGLVGSGCGGQDGAGIGAGQPAAGQPGESGDRGRIEVFEQVTDLIADLLGGDDRLCASGSRSRPGQCDFRQPFATPPYSVESRLRGDDYASLHEPRLRDHGGELGQQRLADVIDPTDVVNHRDRWGFASASSQSWLGDKRVHNCEPKARGGGGNRV
jgi:hypothetical protein